MSVSEPALRAGLVVCLGLAAGCAVETAGSADAPAASQGATTGGAGATVGSTMDAAGPPPGTEILDGGTRPPGADAAEDDAVGTVDLEDPPRPAEPCGDDLDVENGRVLPDLGKSSELDAFRGNPEQPGTFQVLTESVTVPIPAGTLEGVRRRIELTAGELSGSVYLPSGDGSAPALGPFPLVIVLPGFQASYTQYAHFSEHFASHGFVTVGVDTRSDASVASHDTEAAEVSRVLDFLLSPMFTHWARVDGTKVAIAGHSKGGKLAFFAAALDARIDQVIAWDPQNGGGPPCFVDPSACHGFPVAPNCAAQMTGEPGAEGLLHEIRAASLILGVPPDPLITPDPDHNAEHFYRGAPSPAAYVRFDDGHAAWLAPPLGNEAVARISKAVQVATLRARLLGQAGLDPWLPGGSYLEAEPKVSDVRRK